MADRRRSIDNSSFYLFIPLFIPLAPFIFVLPHGSRYLSLRESCLPRRYVSGTLVACHEHKPSLGVPRGQTSSQKLRYVGRSTAAHPGHPLTRQTHASLLNQRRNRPPTYPRLSSSLSPMPPNHSRPRPACMNRRGTPPTIRGKI